MYILINTQEIVAHSAFHVSTKVLFLCVFCAEMSGNISLTKSCCGSELVQTVVRVGPVHPPARALPH